jgi:ABC-type enterochelin transport system ATPase subunit
MKIDNIGEYISPRGAGKMLGVSLFTAIRYLDKGILTGKKHPITNWRYISKESVLSLMKKYGMEMDDSV